jgi:hypothetical protein
MSPKDKEPDPRDYRYLQFVAGRVKGLEDEDMAKHLHCGSAAHLHQRLSTDGYPVCPACGAARHGRTIAKNPRLDGSREKREAESPSSGFFCIAVIPRTHRSLVGRHR